DRKRSLRAKKKRFDYSGQSHNVPRVILSEAKDPPLEAFDTQISLPDPLPFVRSLSSFGMTARSILCLIGSDRALYCISDSVRLLVDLLKLTTFDKQTNFSLCTGITQDHATLAGELFLGFAHQLHHRVQLSKRSLFFHQQIALGLRIFFQTRFQFT